LTFVLTSSAFEDHAAIPKQYGCDGDDVSPPLCWSGTPRGTRSFVLIMDDPDAPDPRAPRLTWVHWVVVNIPAPMHALAENAAADGLPKGAYHGLNDWKRAGYGGPCPPIGEHRYFHKLYALDTLLAPSGHPTKDEVLRAMKGHVLGDAQLVGTYRKATRT